METVNTGGIVMWSLFWKRPSLLRFIHLLLPSSHKAYAVLLASSNREKANVFFERVILCDVETPEWEISAGQMLEKFKTCGITLRNWQDRNSFMARLNSSKVLKNPSLAVAQMLGSENDDNDPPTPFSDQLLFLFGDQCNVEELPYERICERLAGMSQGCLPIHNIKSTFFKETGTTRLSFFLHNHLITWQLYNEGVHVDPAIFSNFSRLLAEQNSPCHFMSLQNDDGTLIGFADEAQKSKLTAETGLDFTWILP